MCEAPLTTKDRPGNRRPVTQGDVRADRVVQGTPAFDQHLRLVQRGGLRQLNCSKEGRIARLVPAFVVVVAGGMVVRFVILHRIGLPREVAPRVAARGQEQFDGIVSHISPPPPITLQICRANSDSTQHAPKYIWWSSHARRTSVRTSAVSSSKLDLLSELDPYWSGGKFNASKIPHDNPRHREIRVLLNT